MSRGLDTMGLKPALGQLIPGDVFNRVNEPIIDKKKDTVKLITISKLSPDQKTCAAIQTTQETITKYENIVYGIVGKHFEYTNIPCITKKLLFNVFT